jgi:uncharacterized protein YlxW (UPF0749 family)
MEDFLIISAIMSVPIVAILAGTLTKIKKLELEKSKGQHDPQVAQLVHSVNLLVKENQELKQRVENLETIVTLGEPSTSQVLGQQMHSLPPPTANPLQNLNKETSKLSGEIAKIIEERRK